MKTLIVGLIRTNCYIISNADTGEAIVIDPGGEAEKIKQYLKANDLVCKGILLTHGHFDHMLAAAEVAGAVNASIYAGEAETGLLKDPTLNASLDLIRKNISLTADILLKDQQILNLAGFKIKVINTPGHTAGGVSYYFIGHGAVFCGDTMFRESVGRSDFPTGDSKTLIASILNGLMVLEDQVKVYPGHGDSTTIGYERDNNIYLSGNSLY